jgi:hypothetical protein
MATPKKSSAPKKKVPARPTNELPEDNARDLAGISDEVPTVTVGDETLNETPDRAAKLLRGIAQIRAVRARLRARVQRRDAHARVGARLGGQRIHR